MPRIGRCKACHRRDDLTRHHVIPKAAGGRNGKDNLVTLCQVCHTLVERFYWDTLATERPQVARYYVEIQQALRDQRVHPTKVEEAKKRINQARQELLKQKRNWSELLREAIDWIETVQPTRSVRMTTHNFVLEEPWWKPRTPTV